MKIHEEVKNMIKLLLHLLEMHSIIFLFYSWNSRNLSPYKFSKKNYNVNFFLK